MVARSFRILFAGAGFGLIYLTLSLAECTITQSAGCYVDFSALHLLALIFTAWGLIVWALGKIVLLSFPKSSSRSAPVQCATYGTMAIIETLVYTTITGQEPFNMQSLLYSILTTNTLWQFLAGCSIPFALDGVKFAKT